MPICLTLLERLGVGNIKNIYTYASNSCFILVNSSLVMDPSPSPSFCNFSLEASKSGLGGAGGICQMS